MFRSVSEDIYIGNVVEIAGSLVTLDKYAVKYADESDMHFSKYADDQVSFTMLAEWHAPSKNS